MVFNEELKLLIKSRYPVVYVESVDEQYVMDQLASIAHDLALDCYVWSVTDGLRRKPFRDGEPDSVDPAQALRGLLDVVRSPGRKTDALFVMKDLERHLDDPVALRLLKDAINVIRNTRTTIIILSSDYRLPADVAACAARIIGGYPTEAEIVAVINETLQELERERRHIAVRLSDTEEGRLIRALGGLSLQQVRNLLNQCLLEHGALDTELLPAIEQRKRAIFDREGLLEFCASESREAIANFDAVKRWMAERRNSFQSASPLLPPPKGVLLIGVQGCGKSQAVKVVAGELGLPLYRLDVLRFYSKYIGETESNLRRALKTIDRLSPCCVWIDEIEKGFAASGGDVDGGVSQRLLGNFLTWMQERAAPCFVAATANDVYALPPEFLRKGRFDEIFFVDLPDARVREDLFRIHLARRKLDPAAFDCAGLAARTEGFSGAEIEQAIISSLYRAGGLQSTLSTDIVEEEIASTRPLAVLKREDIDALREWARGRTVPA